MIGVDTNVLVRHLVQDDPVQSPRASDLLERRLSPSRPGFVSAVVMVELAWVLSRTYRVSRPEVARLLEGVMRIDTLTFEHAREVGESVLMAANGRADFADALIAALALKSGCSHTVTFDRRAQRLRGFAPV